ERQDHGAVVRARKPVRRPLPEQLPRERIIYRLPATCPCCGGASLRKIGEDVAETLELIPRQWKVIQQVREKLSCRTCEAITQLSSYRQAEIMRAFSLNCPAVLASCHCLWLTSFLS